MKLVINFLAYKYIFVVLSRDLDPKEFQDIIAKNKYFALPLIYQIYAAIGIGDYQTAINICLQTVKKSKSARRTCAYLFFLANAYFELGDMKSLRRVCDDFDTCVQTLKYNQSIEKNIHSCLIIVPF